MMAMIVQQNYFSFVKTFHYDYKISVQIYSCTITPRNIVPYKIIVLVMTIDALQHFETG